MGQVLVELSKEQQEILLCPDETKADENIGWEVDKVGSCTGKIWSLLSRGTNISPPITIQVDSPSESIMLCSPPVNDQCYGILTICQISSLN